MSKKKKYNLIPVIVIAVLLVIWQLACAFELVPGYMLPSPIEVVKAFISDFPLLMSHAKVTILEAVLGLVIGVLLGFGCAALMDSFPLVKKGLYPILVLTQTIPPVAIAPLLILWFSYGIAPKVILVVLVAFFPMAVGLLEGFQSVDEDMIRLLKSMDASRWQIFWHVMLPLTRSGLIALSIFTALFAWKDLMWPLIVNTSLDKMPLASGLASLQGQYSTNFPQLMAGSMIAIWPMLILFVLFQKQFIQGVAGTGSKN